MFSVPAKTEKARADCATVRNPVRHTALVQRVPSRQPPAGVGNSVIQRLQQTIGNRAVAQLFRNRTGVRVRQKQTGEVALSSVEKEAVPAARQSNGNTGLPDDLKTGIEQLSGYSLDEVSVHYNSSEPARLNALAYAQGTDIHLAPGQEEHLPHEAWHVVQQMQGRVEPMLQLNGDILINDDKGLEREADLAAAHVSSGQAIDSVPHEKTNSLPSQPVRQLKLEVGTENYDDTNFGTFIDKYGREKGMDPKLMMTIMRMAGETGKTYKYSTISDLINELNPQQEKKLPKLSDVLKELPTPFDQYDITNKGKGVRPLLSTVWVGGRISNAARERLAEWSQQKKTLVVLWMDKAAIEKSGVVEKSGNIDDIPIFGVLPVDGPLGSIEIPVASTESIQMDESLTKAAQAEAKGGLKQVASDILRIAILNQFGGMYIDVGGVTPGKDFNTESFQFYGGMDLQPGFHEETGHMENGLLIARKGSPILGQMLKTMSKYYHDDPQARIKREHELIANKINANESSQDQYFIDTIRYIQNKEEVDSTIIGLVNMPEAAYKSYMEESDFFGHGDFFAHKWKKYIDHLRTMPLKLLTDEIRPSEIKEVGNSVSHSINEATMRDAFQCSIEGWLKHEEKVRKVDISETDLKAHWKTNYSGTQFTYSQKGYSWENPGLSTAEEMERLVGKKGGVYQYFLEKELNPAFAEFEKWLPETQVKEGGIEEVDPAVTPYKKEVQQLLDPTSGLLAQLRLLLSKKAKASEYGTIIEKLGEFDVAAFLRRMELKTGMSEEYKTWYDRENTIINTMRNVVNKIMRFTELVQGE
jgi:hypothetical protein